MGDQEMDFFEDDDDAVSSDDGKSSPGRNARLDREMADLIKERDKFLASGNGIRKKRIARATKPFQYRDHDDRLTQSSSNYTRYNSSDDQPSRPGDRQSRRRTVPTYPPLYDNDGILLSSGRDLCDCLDARCPGCHDECKACGSPKCGMECRCGRTWSHREVIQFFAHKPKEIIRSRPV